MNNERNQRPAVDFSKPTITHIMADGSPRDSVEGYEIPYNENTEHIYRRHAKYIREQFM